MMESPVKLFNEVSDLLIKLPERQRKVIEMRFGIGEYDDEHTLQEIANELSLTYGWIREIEKKALRRIRCFYFRRR
jgi:RNA polymerase primary sigma factor